MATKHMPMSLLLKEERAGHRQLLQLAMRQERLVEMFHEQLALVDAERAEVLASLSSVRGAIHANQRRIALLDCPPELREWQALNTPLIDASDVELVLQGSPQDDAVLGVFHGAKASLPLTVSERAAVEARVAATSMPRLHKIQTPDVLHRKAFVPYYNDAQNRYLRRPCAGDVAVMQANAPPLGRVLVTLREVDAGGVVFAESPWMVVEADATSDVDFLPPALAEVYRTIAKHDEVFKAQALWDRQLVAPLLVWVQRMLQSRAASDDTDADAVDATLLPHLIRALCNPLKDMEPERVEALCGYAQFLRTALPARLQSLLSEDDVVKFLATFAVNAASFQGGDGSLYLRDPAIASPSAVGTSVYACSPSTRCLLGLTSMLEHSCTPNATLVLHRTNSLRDDCSVVVEVRALRPIAAGERLSVSYIPTTLPREERQRLLWSRYWFHCMCAHCSDGLDLLRAVHVPAPGADGRAIEAQQKWMAPAGCGKLWKALRTTHEDDAEEANSLPLHDDVVRAAVRDEAVRQPTVDQRNVVEQLLQLLQRSSGQLSSLLGFAHHRRFAAFVRLCMHLGDTANVPVHLSLAHCIDVLLGYVTWVTEETFAQHAEGHGKPRGASLCQLLTAPNPLEAFFDRVGDSKSSRRERLMGACSAGAHAHTHASGSVDVATHAALFIEPRFKDVGFLAMQLCAAVWETFYAFVHSLLTRSPPADDDLAASLPAKRCGLALGLWLMHKYGLHGHGSAKCLHYQAVLLEDDASCGVGGRE